MQRQSGAEFKKDLQDGKFKLGMFVNSNSPAVMGQLSNSGFDWLLIDNQHACGSNNDV